MPTGSNMLISKRHHDQKKSSTKLSAALSSSSGIGRGLLTFAGAKPAAYHVASGRDFAASSAGLQTIDRLPARHPAIDDRVPALHRRRLHDHIARRPGPLSVDPGPDRESPAAPHSGCPRKLEIRGRVLQPIL